MRLDDETGRNRPEATPPRILHLSDGGTSVVADLASPGGPALVHWGEELDDETLPGLALAARPQRITGGLDVPRLPAVLATPATGWFGTPAVAGHRAGRGASVLLELDAVEQHASSAQLRFTDAESGLSATLHWRVGTSGLFHQRLDLHNTGDTDYTLDTVQLAFPVPADADELLGTAGHWLRERAPERHAFTIGTHVRESRRGRPGLDATLLLAAGRAGFGFERGRVHGIHVAWSGDHRVLAERTADGDALLAGGERFAPGEIILGPGESYKSPDVIGSWGDGLTQLSHRFHDEWRARPQHPTRPRPVSVSTWEAVYFDQGLDRLTALADAAAAVGAERFVLDDGWFEGRRTDRAGLGDWRVDRTIWPDGLHPLVEHVRALGMEFGLWIEPEMVSVDSALAREHPDWILRARTATPPTARGQQVLDLARPEVYAHVAGQLRALLDEYPIAYLKWDHNRDLVDAADGPGGRPRVHEQTLAVYRLIDELKAAFPGLEIETCASGGARVDLGILDRTDRVWVSDSLDPIERLPNQRYTGLVVAPELLGAHLTSPAVHSSGRTVDVSLSAMVALFGHVGLEWDLTTLDEQQLARVAAWVAYAKSIRSLVATGRRIDVDGTDPGLDVRGVVAADGSRGVFTIIQVESGPFAPPSRVRLPGLAPERRYRVEVCPLTPADGTGRTPLAWAEHGVELTGRALATVGVRPPALATQTGLVVEVSARD